MTSGLLHWRGSALLLRHVAALASLKGSFRDHATLRPTSDPRPLEHELLKKLMSGRALTLIMFFLVLDFLEGGATETPGVQTRDSGHTPDFLDQSLVLSGNGLGVKTQRVKTSENFSEESNLARRFRRYPEIV